MMMMMMMDELLSCHRVQGTARTRNLNLTPFRYCDFGRLLVCYSPSEIVPETVEKPFLSIFLGLNHIFTGL